MCVTSGPASLSNTNVAAWEIHDGVHAMGYQNRVQSLLTGNKSKATDDWNYRDSGKEGEPVFDWDSEGYEVQAVSSANCMILPVPLHKDARVMDIGILDTTNMKNCLTDMAIHFQAGASRGMSKTIESYGSRGEVHVIEYDVYSIVLAQFAGDAYNALGCIPSRRRPEIKEALLDSYEEWYRWPVAFCCFDNVEAKTAAPLIFTFPTRFPKKLFLPAIHGHDGEIPDLYSKVLDDHTYIAGSCVVPKGERVNYSDRIDSAVAETLPSHVLGVKANYHHSQGDVVLDLEKIRAGQFQLNRLLPPHAPRLPGIPKSSKA